MATVFATLRGCRNGSSVTAVPSRTFRVIPATYASEVNWSMNGSPGGMRNSPPAS